MKTSIHINKATLDQIRHFPGENLWLDINTDCGIITLSRDDKSIFYKGTGLVIHVPETRRDSRTS